MKSKSESSSLEIISSFMSNVGILTGFIVESVNAIEFEVNFENCGGYIP